MNRHPLCLIEASLEVTSFLQTGHHLSPLLSPCSPPSATEFLVTMVTLELINLVQLPVLVEVFFTVEAPPAVPDTAEEGTSEVHLPMNPHCLVMDCHVSTHCTGEVVRPATIPLVSLT